MARRPFVVQPTAVRHGNHTRRRIDRKPAPRRVRQAVALRVPCIRIHPRRRPHHGPCCRVLRYGGSSEGDIRRPFVDVRDCDSNGLCISTAVPI